MNSYILAADGGGTKTAIVLADLNCKPIKVMRFPRSNPGDIGFEEAIRLLTESFLTVCSSENISPDQISSIFAGIAGGSAGNFAKKLIEALSSVFPNAICGASHDGINVLYSAFPNRDGVCIICGTGSSCFVKKGSDVFRIGGCGQFDLKGNGFEIGRAAFAHVFRAMDGRDKFGWLAESLQERFNGNCHDHIIEINQFTKNQFATYAPLVFEAAYDHQDPCAITIVEDQISYVAELINSAGRFFDGPYEVALAGGVTKHPLTMDIISRHLDRQVSIFQLNDEPYMGAAAKAIALLHGDSPLVESKFQRQL